MNKILKIITFLSISMCMLLPNFATYAGGIDKVIRHGENKMTEYVSHARLKKLVEDQKKNERTSRSNYRWHHDDNWNHSTTISSGLRGYERS